MARESALRMKWWGALVLAGLMRFSASASAVEPKALRDVDIAAFTAETQRANYVNGTHVAWWVPAEFWEVSLERNEAVDPKARKKAAEILRKYSMLAVAQAEMGSGGSFIFYDRDTVTRGMKVEYLAGGQWSTLNPLSEIPPDIQPLFSSLTPVISNALGQLGRNLNFYVLADTAKGQRIVSPYAVGQLRITLSRKGGAAIDPFVIEMPLDALYVPRRCPNGKPAHVSWVVCPWDGTKLPL